MSEYSFITQKFKNEQYPKRVLRWPHDKRLRPKGEYCIHKIIMSTSVYSPKHLEQLISDFCSIEAKVWDTFCC
jgi:hypothetical protein